MLRDLDKLLASWLAQGIDPDVILSRFYGVAVAAMISAGVTREQMIELVDLYYGKNHIPNAGHRAQRIR